MNVTDVTDIPQPELCSYCMTEKLAMMQADAYSSAYGSNWQTIYEEVAAQCNLTASDFNATTSAFNVSVPVTITNCVTGVTYTTVDGDTCDSISLEFDITLDQFYAWNTEVGSSCEDLWSSAYVCVGAE